MPFGLWAWMIQGSHVFARFRRCAHMGGQIGATWRIRLNCLSVAAMRSMWNYFDHLLVFATQICFCVHVFLKVTHLYSKLSAVYYKKLSVYKGVSHTNLMHLMFANFFWKKCSICVSLLLINLDRFLPRPHSVKVVFSPPFICPCVRRMMQKSHR